MDPVLFASDIEQKPIRLRALADEIDNGWPHWPPLATSPRVLMIGMGSSLYAAQVAALRMRAAGVTAMAETAAANRTLQLGPDDLVIGISASGGSAETLRLFGAVGEAPRAAVTNQPESAITAGCDLVVPLLAGEEAGGVSCITFVHTVVALLALEQHLVGTATDLTAAVRRAAEATQFLIEGRADWLDRSIDLLCGPDGTWLLAPAERLSSAMQGALMLREGPRRAAVGCETGDWSHVDVYLTKSLDYRAMLFPGSLWDAAAARWLAERASTVVAVGGEFDGAQLAIRFPHDDDPIVALLVDTVVPELIAAALWSNASP